MKRIVSLSLLVVLTGFSRAATLTNGTGLLGQYYNNMDFTAFVLERVDATINFDWGTGSPNVAIGADSFSVRWTGYVAPRYSQTYTFSTTTDDGVRLWVNGQPIVDAWVDQSPTTRSGTIALSADTLYEIQMDYYENSSGAVAKLLWSSPSQAQEIIPQVRLYRPTPGVNRRPLAPTITEPRVDGQLVNSADVHMETAPFSDPDAGQLHVCSDFEIWTVTPSERVWITACIGGIEKLHTHLGDGIFQGSHAGGHELFYDTDYRLRVRHKDSSGDPVTQWSNWSERRFRTTSAVDPIPGAPGWRVLQTGYKVEVVASGFQLPVNIAFVPNPGSAPSSPYYYVTELYGAIKVVTRDGTIHNYATNLLNFNPTGAFPGSGEQGVAGIVVNPGNGDIYATMLYESGAGGPHYPKVVRFTSNDGGLSGATQTTILDMPGETQGQSHQVSNISFGPDGKLYVHMGDGFDATMGQNTNSFRGKILRIELNGRPCVDNPFYRAANGTNATDYIFAYGLRNPFGGDWRAADNAHYEVENGPSVDRFAKIVRGRNYLYDGSDGSMANFAIYNWNPSVGPVNIAFIQTNRFNGSGFPSNKFDHAFVSESGPTWASGPQSNGKRISEFVLDANGNRVSGPTPLIEYNGTGKATVVALAAGPDGLYFSDLYKDVNYTSAIDRGANILRVRWVGTNPVVTLTSPANGATFRAGTNILLAATAAGTGTDVSLVEFFSGASKLGQDSTGPYQFTWSNVVAGAYQLTARAIDARGIVGTSAVVSITVNSNILVHGENATGNQFRLWFNAVNGVSYVIEASANLRTWTPVRTNVVVNNRFEWLDNRTLLRRFYRARQE
ncbi:MAG TPA: PA14 domain-containing protein [Candidatus Binatia bacterium]|nr:PA14 domain-containing protein [Candidatus Binatia bacterium]